MIESIRSYVLFLCVGSAVAATLFLRPPASSVICYIAGLLMIAGVFLQNSSRREANLRTIGENKLAKKYVLLLDLGGTISYLFGIGLGYSIYLMRYGPDQKLFVLIFGFFIIVSRFLLHITSHNLKKKGLILT
jgi:hypothetical protein